MRVVFLGVSGSVAAPGHRGPAVLAGRYLLDCGEGVASALIEAGLLDEVDYVLISHFHADHVVGLVPLIWAYMLLGRDRELVVAGPPGTRELVWSLVKLLKTPVHRVEDFLRVVDLKPGDRLGGAVAVRANHPVETLAFRVDEGGSSVCYAGDTAQSSEVVELTRGCDLLIHDSTYPPGREEEAAADGHSTPVVAAQVAEEAGVKALALFHLPFYRMRGYKFLDDYLKAAREHFSGLVFAPRELQVLEV